MKQECEHNENDLVEILKQPVRVFRIFRRLTQFFQPEIDTILKSQHKIYMDFMKKINKLNDTLPSNNDLNNAAEAIQRLQSVYRLTADQLVRGQFRTTKSSGRTHVRTRPLSDLYGKIGGIN